MSNNKLLLQRCYFAVVPATSVTFRLTQRSLRLVFESASEIEHWIESGFEISTDYLRGGLLRQVFKMKFLIHNNSYLLYVLK